MPDFSALSSRVSGAVIERSDPQFADAVAGFNLSYSQSPDAVVAATSTADIVETVRFAAEHSLPIRVQATGHGAHGTITDGILIDTSRLNSVTIDADATVATIGAGARWAAVVAAAAPHGLAPITGSSTNVGVVGYLLGGGLGPLSRSHGFSSDYLLSATLVTASGEVVEASADSHPELLWALRGGKAGFGVVTEVRLRLVEMPSLYAGALTFAAPHVETVLRGWVDYTATADDNVTTSAVIYHFPPVEQLPEHLRGQTLIALRFAFPGDATKGERLAAPLRALAPAILDTLGAMPLADVAAIHGDPEEPGLSWGRSLLLVGEGTRELDQDFATTLLASVGVGVQTPLLATEMRHLGAATRTDVAEGSPIGGRASGYTMTLIGAPNPALFAEVLPAVAGQLIDSIADWVSPETTINFAAGGGPAEQARAWPAETRERLEAVRAQVDPAGLFPFAPEH